MYGKLSVRNIRRSMRDYAIYFVTIVLGVAVFYAFNSIGEQQILFDLESEADASMFRLTTTVLAMFSVVIAFVLGFLVVYANRFLIRRRKREFGTYLLLGMSSSGVSRIVLYETVLVGVLSLAVGLVVGIVLAQGLSFVTAALFGIVMSHYQFVFSTHALNATLLCFVAIYVVVAAFNTVSVMRYRLIDLISAQAKSEKMHVRNPWVCLAVFAASIIVIAAAYWNLNENGLVMLDDPRFVRATVLMLVGTLLFFWSVAGFAVLVLQQARGVYFRGLAMFTVRQVASKISTATASLWLVCVMLFFSITVFSCGMGLVQVFTNDIDESTVFDATLRSDVYYVDAVSSVQPNSNSLSQRRDLLAAEEPETYAEFEKWGGDVVAKLSAEMPGWADFVRAAAQVDLYEAVGATYGDLLGDANASSGTAELDDAVKESSVLVLRESQYNDVRAMLGRETIELSDGECMIDNTYAALQPIADAIAARNAVLSICGHDLHVSDEVAWQQLETNMMLSASLYIIVPDGVVDDMVAAGAIPTCTYTDIMYVDSVTRAEGDDILAAGLAAMQPDIEGDSGYNQGFSFQSELWPVTMVYSGFEMLSQMGGMRLMITYLALYIGFVFLVATAAVLAIQQLSEAADSLPRYRMLFEIGCDERMIFGSLRTQVLLYFLVPLALALCHAACAICVMSSTLFNALAVPVAGPIAMAAVFTVAVYGGYLAITYFTSRSIIRTALK